MVTAIYSISLRRSVNYRYTEFFHLAWPQYPTHPTPSFPVLISPNEMHNVVLGIRYETLTLMNYLRAKGITTEEMLIQCSDNLDNGRLGIEQCKSLGASLLAVDLYYF